MLNRRLIWTETKQGFIYSYFHLSYSRIFSPEKIKKDFGLVWGGVIYDLDPGRGRPIDSLMYNSLLWLVRGKTEKARKFYSKDVRRIISEHGLLSILSALGRDEITAFKRVLVAMECANQSELDECQVIVDKLPLEEKFWQQPLLFSEIVDRTIADGYLEFCLQQAEAGQFDPSPLSPILFAYDFVFDKLSSPLEQVYLQRFMYVATFEHDASSERYLTTLRQIVQNHDLDKLMEPLHKSEKRILASDLKKFGVLPDERSFA